MAKAPEFEIIWSAQPKQAAFIACPADDVAFGGARGGGKSDGVVGDWASHEDLYHEHAIGLALRRERTQLIELIERAKQILVPIGHKWHEQDKYFRGPNGGRLRFAYLENDSDADAYQGHGYTRIYFEEVGTFPSESPVAKLMATLRSGQGVPCQIKSTCNPGGPGHQWVKARYKLDTHPQGMEVFRFEFINPFTKKKIEKTRVFIPSKVVDNKFLGDDYVANLFQVGSENLVKAWLSGDWSVIEGAFFPEWSMEKHVIRPFEIPDSWTRFRSADWGSAKPFSVGWWAVVGDDCRPLGDIGPMLPRGALVRYREWYGASSPNVGLKLTAEAVAEGIVARETNEARGIDGESAISYGVLDPAAFASDGGPSIAERMALPPNRIFFRRADNARVSTRGAMGGWDQVRSRLVGDGDRPMIYFFSTCRDTIRTLPAMQHDMARPEDIDTESEDHACFVSGTIIDGYGDIGRIGVLTRRSARIIRLEFDDGSSIECTPDHQFLTEDQWKPASQMLHRRALSAPQFKSLEGYDITSVAFIFSAKACDFIAKSGNMAMDLFQTVSMSIIGITTVLITILKTCCSCEGAIISAFMVPTLSSAQRREMPQPSGTDQTTARSGIASITDSMLLQRWKNAQKWFARCAGTLSRRALSLRIAQSSAAITARPKLCVAVVPLSERKDVYCMGVKAGWISVNGLAVSNCDEVRYACMSRPYVKENRVKTPGKILAVGPGNQVSLDDLWEKPSIRQNQRV